ncbi:hypothetical protein PFISCL1PPCAC_21030, partial [Pristionchus fissidentatus]
QNREMAVARQPDGVINWTVDFFCTGDQVSPSTEIDGIEWALKMQIARNEGGYGMSFKVQLETSSELTADYSVKAEFDMLNPLVIHKEVVSLFTDTQRSVDFGHLAAYDQLARACEYHGETPKFKALLYVDRIKTNGGGPVTDFSSSDNDLTDCVLRIDDHRIHVSRQLLAVHSPVFKAMLFGDFKDKNQAEIEIKEVVYEEFIDLLRLIYPDRLEITCQNYEHLLKLADHFEVKSVISEVVQFVRRSKKFDNLKLIVLADKYQLQGLLDRCIGALRSSAEIATLKAKVEYLDMSDATKLALFERVMQLI